MAQAKPNSETCPSLNSFSTFSLCLTAAADCLLGRCPRLNQPGGMPHAATAQHPPARDYEGAQAYCSSSSSSIAAGFSSPGAAAARPTLTPGYRVQVVPWRPDDDDQAGPRKRPHPSAESSHQPTQRPALHTAAHSSLCCSSVHPPPLLPPPISRRYEDLTPAPAASAPGPGSPSKVNLASSSPNLSPSHPPVQVQARADHISVPYLGTPRAAVSSPSCSPHRPSHSAAASHAPPPSVIPEPQQLRHLKQQQQVGPFAPGTPPKGKHNEEADKEQHHHHHYHYLEPRLESPKAAQSPGGGNTSSSNSGSSSRAAAYTGTAAPPYEPSSSNTGRSKRSPEAPKSSSPKPKVASPEPKAPPGPRYGQSQEGYRYVSSPAVTEEASPRAPSNVAPDLAALAREGLFTGRDSNGSIISSGSDASFGRCHVTQPYIEQLPGPQQPEQPLPDFLELFSGREYPGNPHGGDPHGGSPPDSTPSSPSPSLVEALRSSRDAPPPPDMGKGYAAIHGRQGILTQLSEASDALNEAAAPLQR